MTIARWKRSMVRLALWTGAAIYAVHYIHNAWGFVILANLYWAAGCVLVNTVRLLCSATPVEPPLRRRRIILEEEEPWPTALTR